MVKDKRKVFLGIGSNLGDLNTNLNTCIQLLDEKLEIVQISSFVESEPWGNEKLNPFLNTIIMVNTEMDPHQLLEYVKRIEEIMGRQKTYSETYENRLIDVDIILYEDLVLESKDLCIPHRHMTTREFVLRPLLELDQHLLHPKHKVPIINYLRLIDPKV